MSDKDNPSSKGALSMAAEQYYVGLEAAEQAMREIRTGQMESPSIVLPNQIARLIDSPMAEDVQLLRQRMREDFVLYRRYRQMLASHAAASMTSAIAAASSDMRIEREADQFALSVKPSRADPDQCYLVLQAKRSGLFDAPRRLLVTRNGETEELQLPAGIEGVVQKVLMRKSAMLDMLVQSDTMIAVI